MEDLKQYRGVSGAHEIFPRLTDELPPRLCGLLIEAYRQAQEPKRRIQRRAIRRLLDGLPKRRTARDLWRVKGMIG
jgi:hypothetical protein